MHTFKKISDNEYEILFWYPHPVGDEYYAVVARASTFDAAVETVRRLNGG